MWKRPWKVIRLDEVMRVESHDGISGAALKRYSYVKVAKGTRKTVGVARVPEADTLKP